MCCRSSVATIPGSMTVTRMCCLVTRLSQGLGESTQGPLGSIVPAVASLDLPTGHRRDVHNMTSILRLHDRQHFLAGQHHCQHIEIKHLPPFPGIDAFDLM